MNTEAKMHKNKPKFKPYKIFVYLALFLFALSIIVPIAWVFMASLKTESEETHLHYHKNQFGITMLMLGIKPIWVSTYLIPFSLHLLL